MVAIEIYIAKKYANPQKFRRFEEKCDLVEVLFKNYPFYMDGVISVTLPDLKNLFKKNQIPPITFSRLLCKADQLPRNNPLALYEQPLYLCPDNIVRFSLPVLYDALIYQYTQLMQEKDSGHRRAFRAENYVGFLIEQFIHDHFPAENLKLFKLILLNKDPLRRGKGWEDLQQYLPEFQYNNHLIELTEQQLGTQFKFLEFDLLFLFKDILVVVDVKDDLFWEAKDLPAPVILWGRQQQAKITDQVAHLLNPHVRAELEKVNIQYNRVESLVITQGHLNCGGFNHIGDLFKALQKIHWGEELAVSINTLKYVPYPW